MARYLVVADQTATSPELLMKVAELATSDPAAQFVLLVPATPVQHLLAWEERETRRAARARAEAARARFQEAGATVIEAKVGDASPLLAIADEMRAQPQYDAVVISTFPLGLSRWLRLDLPRRVRQEYSLPVIHVVAERRPLPGTVREEGRSAESTKASTSVKAPSRSRDIKRAAAKEEHQ